MHSFYRNSTNHPIHEATKASLRCEARKIRSHHAGAQAINTGGCREAMRPIWTLGYGESEDDVTYDMKNFRNSMKVGWVASIALHRHGTNTMKLHSLGSEKEAQSRLRN